MIPTSYKAKIGYTLSWPVGAEAISAALGGVPHAEEILLRFFGPYGADRLRQVLCDEAPYELLRGDYNHLAAVPWSMHVSAVRRGKRHCAGLLLREQGLAAVAQWLRSSEQKGWEQWSHTIRLIFNPMDDSLTIERDDGV